MAPLTSGTVRCAFVTAMVGRMSRPPAMSSANASLTMCPQGSSDTMRSGSDHGGYGPIGSAGEVSVRSGTWTGSSRPAATASAR